jgi:hypothetical protein
MSENCNLQHANDGLITGERSATVLHPLDNAIHALEIFPYESVNSLVFGNGLEFIVWKDIAGCGAFNQNIIDIGNGDMWYLGLDDVRDVIVEYRNGVSPSHQQSCESESTQWTPEGCEVARRFSNSMFVIADEKVHHSGTGATCELFSKLFSKGQNAGMHYSDCVEFLKRFHPVKSTVLFRNSKPAIAIGGVGWFKNAGIHFLLNDFADFIIYSGWYRQVALSPRLMGDSGDLDRWEEVFAKMSVL